MTINPITSIDYGGSLSSQSEQSSDQASQRRQVAQAIQTVNNSSTLPEGREYSMSVDSATKQVVARLIDSNTGDVISQVPAEYILRIASYFEAQAVHEKHVQTPLLPADM